MPRSAFADEQIESSGQVVPARSGNCAGLLSCKLSDKQMMENAY